MTLYIRASELRRMRRAARKPAVKTIYNAPCAPDLRALMATQQQEFLDGLSAMARTGRLNKILAAVGPKKP